MRWLGRRPAATTGVWDAAHVIGLERVLCQLLNEDIPNVFTKFRYDEELLYLRRRKTVGNMTFTDSGTFIGDEPGWHKKVRRKRSEAEKEKRAKCRQEEAQAEKNGALGTWSTSARSAPGRSRAG